MNSIKLHDSNPLNEDEQTEKLGRRIYSLRRQTGLTRKEFCKKYNIPLGTMGNWEIGRNRGFTHNNIQILLAAFAAESLSTTADYILFGKKEDDVDLSDNEPSLVELARQNLDKQAILRSLLQAVRSGRNDDVADIIKNNSWIQLNAEKIDFKSFSYNGNSLLHEAARKGHVNVLATLIAEGSEVNSTNRFCETPLHIAIKGGYEAIVMQLILNDADINAKDRNGETPLSVSCYFGQKAIAKQLIKAGANINSKNIESYTPLHWASYSGFEDIVKLLLDNKADAFEKNYIQETPLDCAIKSGNVRIVELLEKI